MNKWEQQRLAFLDWWVETENDLVDRFVTMMYKICEAIQAVEVWADIPNKLLGNPRYLTENCSNLVCYG